MARKKTKEEKEYLVLVANMRELLKTKYGKEVLWHILSLTGVYATCFTGNTTTFFNEGQRSIGLQLMELMDDADISAYPRLLLEKREVEDGPESDTDADTITDTGDSG